jgi:drug/metabolite transporter (DMT)-like permease
VVRGVVYAIIACFLWGFIFVIPSMITEFSSLEIVLGRYITFGIISSFLLFRKGFETVRLFSYRDWTLAFLFAFGSNVLYYLGIVLSLDLASPPVTVVIAGLAPIVVALYGNWHVREISYKNMILPCLWIFSGLILVNYSDLMNVRATSSIQAYIIGVTLAFLALFSWCAYAVHNARFLKKRPGLPPESWVSVLGVCAMLSSLFLWIVFALLDTNKVQVQHYIVWSSALRDYLLGVGFLGIISTWLAFFFWNRAGIYLPVSMLGPLVIFEFVFGLLMIYIFEWRLPTWQVIIGVLLLLSGTLYALYTFKKKAYKLPHQLKADVNQKPLQESSMGE